MQRHEGGYYIRLLARDKPKLFILNSVAHNPTGSCMSAGVATRVLELAARHDFMILEDDIFGDLQGRHAVRLASLDDGRRVIYVGGFAKTLAANLRVGFVAAHQSLARACAHRGAPGLSSMTERVVARIIIERSFGSRTFVSSSMSCARLPSVTRMGESEARPGAPPVGSFGRDTNELATPGYAKECCAPRRLFSPTQLPSTWMRVAAATCLNATAMAFLQRAMRR
jgi:hypothetical protein